MPVNGFDIPDTLVIPLSTVSFDGCLDALPCLFRIGIQVKAYLFFSQGPMKALNTPYGLRMTRRNTLMPYAQLEASLLKGG